MRDALERQPIEEQHDYYIGTDAEGNSYLHFPQFCGPDLRVYRHSKFKVPKVVIKPEKTPKVDQFSHVYTCISGNHTLVCLAH